MSSPLICPDCGADLGKDTENPKKAYCSTCGRSDIPNPRGTDESLTRTILKKLNADRGVIRVTDTNGLPPGEPKVILQAVNSPRRKIEAELKTVGQLKDWLDKQNWDDPKWQEYDLIVVIRGEEFRAIGDNEWEQT